MTDGEQEASADDVKDALADVNLGPRFVDALLLSIIRAYPAKDGKTDEQRLRSAIKALFDDEREPSKQSQPLYQALLWMADEYVCSRGGPGLPLSGDLHGSLEKNRTGKTASDLAKIAQMKFSLNYSTEYLRNQFAQKKYELCLAVTLRNDAPETLTSQALAVVHEQLTLFGIETVSS